MRCKTFLLLSAVFFSGLFFVSRAHADCTVWEKVFSVPQSGTRVAVLPFHLQSSNPQDSWLSQGLRFFLSDLLKSAKGVGITSSQHDAHYVFQGTVQRFDTHLRVFVSITRGEELVKHYELKSTLPLQRTFFLHLADLARTMFKDLKLDPQETVFTELRDVASSVAAYQFYTRGRELLLSFDTSRFAEAEKWFSEAKRLDFRSPLGFAGSFETALLLAFEARQAQKPFRPAFEKAEEELKLIEQYHIKVPDALFLLPHNSLQKDDEGKSLNRFFDAHAAFISALAHYHRGDLRKAEEALQHLLAKTPEDGLAWYYLGKTSLDLHREKSAEKYFAKAHEWNTCLP